MCLPIPAQPSIAETRSGHWPAQRRITDIAAEHALDPDPSSVIEIELVLDTAHASAVRQAEPRVVRLLRFEWSIHLAMDGCRGPVT